jgi:hypothetical protein
VPGAFSLVGEKWAARAADHSLPSGADVENGWSYTSITPTRLHGVALRYAQGQLYVWYSFL